MGAQHRKLVARKQKLGIICKCCCTITKRENYGEGGTVGRHMQLIGIYNHEKTVHQPCLDGVYPPIKTEITIASDIDQGHTP